MPSQPFSASRDQNSGVVASSVAIMRRTKRVSHSPSRNLRAASRNNSCSSLKPISIAPLPDAKLPGTGGSGQACDPGDLQRLPELTDLLALPRIREAAEAGFQVVRHVRRIGGG